MEIETSLPDFGPLGVVIVKVSPGCLPNMAFPMGELAEVRLKEMSSLEFVNNTWLSLPSISNLTKQPIWAVVGVNDNMVFFRSLSICQSLVSSWSAISMAASRSHLELDMPLDSFGPSAWTICRRRSLAFSCWVAIF